MEIELDDEERSYILECIGRDVEAADEVEQNYYQERLFDTAEEFLDVMDGHYGRMEMLADLRIKLGGNDGSEQPNGTQRILDQRGPSDSDVIRPLREGLQGDDG